MNVAAEEDPRPEGTASDPSKENAKGRGKRHGKRHGERYGGDGRVSEEHRAGYSHEQPG